MLNALSHRWLMTLIVAGTIFAGLHPAVFSYLVVGMGFLLTFMWRDERSEFVRADRVTVLLVLALFIFAAVSLHWTTDPARALYDLLATGILSLVALCLPAGISGLSSEQIRQGLRWFIAVYGFAFLCLAMDLLFNLVFQRALLHFEWQRYAPLSLADRSCFCLLLLLWPALVYLWQRGWRISAGLLWFFIGVFMLLSDTAAGRLAFAVSTLVGGLSLMSPRMARVILGIAMLGGLGISVPLAEVAQGWATDHIHPINGSFGQRLEIWEFTAKRILEKPILGWGFDSARAIPNMGEVSKYQGPLESIIPVHPHDWFLQIILELGVVGAGLMIALWLWWLHLTSRLHPAVQPAALAIYSVAMVIGGFSIGMWQSWWLAALIFTAMILQLLSRWATAETAP